jgi:hypothetical protein
MRSADTTAEPRPADVLNTYRARFGSGISIEHQAGYSGWCCTMSSADASYAFAEYIRLALNRSFQTSVAYYL